MIDLAALNIEQAVLLPGIQEAGGKCLKFTLLPRLTSHVRHKAKYLDMKLVAEQSFWFCGGHTISGPARTLKEFLRLLNQSDPKVVVGHAQRGDFSRWIADIFHDHVLASGIRKIEQRFRLGHLRDLTESIAKSIEDRYEFSQWDFGDKMPEGLSGHEDSPRDLIAVAGKP